MKFLLSFLIGVIVVMGFSLHIFADKDNQICIDKILMENTKGKNHDIKLVSPLQLE